MRTETFGVLWGIAIFGIFALLALNAEAQNRGPAFEIEISCTAPEFGPNWEAMLSENHGEAPIIDFTFDGSQHIRKIRVYYDLNDGSFTVLGISGREICLLGAGEATDINIDTVKPTLPGEES